MSKSGQSNSILLSHPTSKVSGSGDSKVEVTNEFILDLNEMTIEELQRLKDELIEKYEYKKAEVVDGKIKKKMAQTNDEHLNNYVKFYNDRVDDIVKSYQDKVDEISKRYSKELHDLRVVISDTFHQLQIQHIQILVEYEKEYILRHSKQTAKIPQEVFDLIDRADKAAQLKKYERAQDLFDKASSQHVNYHDFIKNTNKKDYLYVRKEVLKAQRNELTTLSAQLTTGIHKLKSEKASEINKLKVMCNKDITTMQIELMKDINRNVKTTTLRNQTIAQIKSAYKESLKKFKPKTTLKDE